MKSRANKEILQVTILCNGKSKESQLHIYAVSIILSLSLNRIIKFFMFHVA